MQMSHMRHLVEVCVSLCSYDNLKTIAYICFLLGSYVDWRKISDEFTSKSRRSRSKF